MDRQAESEVLRLKQKMFDMQERLDEANVKVASAVKAIAENSKLAATVTTLEKEKAELTEMCNELIAEMEK